MSSRIGKRGLLRKVALSADQEGFYLRSMEPASLVGKVGVAATDLRPSGRVLMDGEYCNFTHITIGANATLGTDCIGAHSTEFINDYTANNKLAGTYVWDGSHWIYQ